MYVKFNILKYFLMKTIQLCTKKMVRNAYLKERKNKNFSIYQSVIEFIFIKINF